MSKLPSLNTVLGAVEKAKSNTYKAVKTTDWGLSYDNCFITGMKLVIEKQGNWYDPLADTIPELGTDIVVHLPDEGLVEGALYEAYEVCESTDWETNECNETSIHINRIE